MYRPRIIPVLLLNGTTLSKSVQFGKHNYIGDPINAVRLYNDLKADELVFLDIQATKKGQEINFDLIAEIGEEANMPFSVGGGIKTIDQIRRIISAGAEKVILNTSALRDSEFVKEAVATFGSSTIAVCIDVKKKFLGSQKVYNHSTGQFSDYLPVNYAKSLEEMGVGEIIVQSVDRDGTMTGYDLELIKSISESLTIPVVALGGAGSLSDMQTLLKHTTVNGLAAGSLFVYQGTNKGVLISYPNRAEIRAISI
jgi:imidazole glycerol-phosphate synthase subunit HisF